jgi:hypothetical protein
LAVQYQTAVRGLNLLVTITGLFQMENADTQIATKRFGRIRGCITSDMPNEIHSFTPTVTDANPIPSAATFDVPFDARGDA